MEVSLATPEKLIFSGNAEDVLLNAEKGQINLLERHSNLITLVKPGKLRVKINSSTSNNFDVSEGVLKIEGDKVNILCNEIKTA